MLRMLTIAALFLLNLSVWIGPAASLLSYTATLVDHSPRIERAEHFVVAGDYSRAFTEFQALVAARPENASYHYEYGLFCYINHAVLQDILGKSPLELARIAQSELFRSRELTPEDLDFAYDYAFTLMDDEVFRDSEFHEPAAEAWEHVLMLAEARHRREPDWIGHSTMVPQAITQLARVASRFGSPEQASVYLAQVQVMSPEFRISSEFVEQNAALYAE